MKRNNDVLEERNMLVSEGDSESRNDGGQDVKEFSSSVEFMRFVNEGVEGLILCLPNHLASGHELGIQLVENVFKVVAFYRFLRVKKFKELLDELGGHVHFQTADFDTLINYELEEELIDTLEVVPSRVHFVISFHTSLSETEVSLLNTGERSKNVLFNHLHDLIQIRDD